MKSKIHKTFTVNSKDLTINMKKDIEKTIKEETILDCPILYQTYTFPKARRNHCFYWEHGDGWNEAVSDMSRRLEVINDTYYDKYRVRVQVEQIKEKFGGLRVYYSVLVDPNRMITWFMNKLGLISNSLENSMVDYGVKYVTDIEPYDYDETVVVSKEEYENGMKYKPMNVKYITTKDNKIVKITKLHNYGKRHMVATRHKFLWFVKNMCNKINALSLRWFHGKDNSKTRNIVRVVDIETDRIIKETEKTCSETCEKCGRQIGREWSPTCTTTGWITNICEDCAIEAKRRYYKDGKLYENGKEIVDEKHNNGSDN